MKRTEVKEAEHADEKQSEEEKRDEKMVEVLLESTTSATVLRSTGPTLTSSEACGRLIVHFHDRLLAFSSR